MVLVFGYSYKIPVELFAIPKLGFYNLHFSLLPAYRGKEPVFWQIKNGESKGGITIHQMTGEYDTGPVLVQHEVAIFSGENHGLYSGRLSMESVSAIGQAIEKLDSANIELSQQNNNEVSTAPGISANDLRINWETHNPPGK